MWGRGQKGDNPISSAFAPLSISSSTNHKWIVPFQVLPWWWFLGGVVYILGLCGLFQRTLLWDWQILPPPQPQQVFTVRGFQAFFPCAGTLGCAVCLTLQLFLPVYLHSNVEPPAVPATISPTQLPISTSSAGLGECFFFSSLVVGFRTVRFSGSSGCFLFLNWLLSLFWLCKKAKHIYLCFHLGQKLSKIYCKNILLKMLK